MMAPQIKLELLEEFKKKGKLLVIWRCERCFKKIPFYNQGNSHYGELANMICLCWAKDHKYCSSCEKKIKNKNNPKPKQDTEIMRISSLLEKYELPLEEEDYLWIDIQKPL